MQGKNLTNHNGVFDIMFNPHYAFFLFFLMRWGQTDDDQPNDQAMKKGREGGVGRNGWGIVREPHPLLIVSIPDKAFRVS